MKMRMMGTAGLLVLMFPCGVWTQTVADRSTAANGQVVREIRDPHNGMRWLLERSIGNSGAPGRMVLLNDRESPEVCLSKSPNRQPDTKHEAQSPVIRTGDRLVIEDHSALVDARLEAISLSAAIQGAEFNARLTIGGTVVRAIAIAPGRAAFAAGAGER
jgi:hypothetical protein